MVTYLVTGGAGFVGSHVCDKLLEQGHTVICVDSFHNHYAVENKEKNIASASENSRFVLVRKDINDDLDAVFAEHKPSIVIHLAARPGVGPSLRDPTGYMKSNVTGTVNLLQTCVKHGIKRFVAASSSSVYGTLPTPFKETMELQPPLSPYALTKQLMERVAAYYHHNYDVSTVCLRFFNVYGPRGRPDMAPWIFVQNVLQEKPIHMFGDGSMARDWTYVDNIVKGVLSAALYTEKSCCEIINLGNNKPVVLRDMIATVEKVVGKKATIIQKPHREGDVPATWADIAKAQQLLGYDPYYDLEEGLGHFVAWFREKVDRC